MLAPSVAIAVVFIYGFILITGYLSLTNSRLLPNYEFDGFGRYSDLFQNDVCGPPPRTSAGSGFRSS